MDQQPSDSPRRTRLAVLALVVAAFAAALPVFWFAAVLAVGIITVMLSGRTRWLVLGVGGLLTVVSCVRFALEHAKPNLSAESPEVEKIALSHLREVYRAQAQARQFKLVDADGDGTGEYLAFPEILGETPDRLRDRPPLLKPGLFRRVDPERAIYESERYFFVVYLPGKDGQPTVKASESAPAASSRAFAAYAWPVDSSRGRHRAFYVDQFEQICVSHDFVGPEQVPTPSAYALQASEGISFCGQDETGETWKPWTGRSGRQKEPRATR